LIDILFANIYEYRLHLSRLTRFIPELLVSISILAITPILTAGCQSIESTPTVLYFPVQKEPREYHPMALTEGNLLLEKGSLRITHYFFVWQTYSELIIWPFGYSWKLEDNIIWVLDETDEKVAKAGDSVKSGGDDISSSNGVEAITGREIPGE